MWHFFRLFYDKQTQPNVKRAFNQKFINAKKRKHGNVATISMQRATMTAFYYYYYSTEKSNKHLSFVFEFIISFSAIFSNSLFPDTRCMDVCHCQNKNVSKRKSRVRIQWNEKNKKIALEYRRTSLVLQPFEEQMDLIEGLFHQYQCTLIISNHEPSTNIEIPQEPTNSGCHIDIDFNMPIKTVFSSL